MSRRREPVKVTAWLAGPMAGNAPMLDGVLEWSMLRHMSQIKQTRGGYRHAHRLNSGHNVVPISIARDPIGGWLIPRCSSPILPRPICEYVQFFCRPMVTDGSLISERRKINTSSGPNKSCRLPLRIRLIDRIVWFAMAEFDGSKGAGRSPGRPLRRLEKRLRPIKHLGAKSSYGYGEVYRWQVEPADNDWSWYAPSDDGPVLMRPLPRAVELPDDLRGACVDFDRPCGPYNDKHQACEVVKPC